MSNLPPPDWDRYRVDSRANASNTGSPLGNPMRWGGYAQQIIQAQAPYQSEQIFRLQTEDTYSRLWAALGTVNAPVSLWAEADATWVCVLSLELGAGQQVIRQQIDLRLLTTLGLAVYRPMSVPGVVTNEPYEQRAFAMIGGLVGNAVSGRMLNVLPLAPLGSPAAITIDVVVTPLAAGSGL